MGNCSDLNINQSEMPRTDSVLDCLNGYTGLCYYIMLGFKTLHPEMGWVHPISGVREIFSLAFPMQVASRAIRTGHAHWTSM